jgi:hypothetical protein
MIFKSHFFSMVIFAFISSGILAMLKYNDLKRIALYAIKLFAFMVGGVVLMSWIMYFI